MRKHFLREFLFAQCCDEIISFCSLLRFLRGLNIKKTLRSKHEGNLRKLIFDATVFSNVLLKEIWMNVKKLFFCSFYESKWTYRISVYSILESAAILIPFRFGWNVNIYIVWQLLPFDFLQKKNVWSCFASSSCERKLYNSPVSPCMYHYSKSVIYLPTKMGLLWCLANGTSFWAVSKDFMFFNDDIKR